jgi:hypothetical protein
MGYQATIKKQGLSAIFDIKGDASAASKRLSHLGLSLPSESKNTAIEKDGQHLCWIGEDTLAVARTYGKRSPIAGQPSPA